MGLIKMFRWRYFIGMVVVIGGVSQSHAQQIEAEWRVVNESPSMTVPLLANTKNPFPIKEYVPPVEVALQPDPLDEASKAKANLLDQARKLMTSDKGFAADVSQISFRGYVNGPQGARALYGTRWVGEKDAVRVSLQGAEEAYKLIEEVTTLDKDLGENLRNEMKNKLTAAQGMTLAISHITSSSVVMQGNGRTFTFPIRQNAF